MLKIFPITQKEAKKFVELHHRHHGPPIGSIFQIACKNSAGIVGVAIVGRPVSRMLQDGQTAEITRCCTNGTKNACSILYAAAWRAARALGYHRLVTYILSEEPGTSLNAAGWKLVGQCGGGSWHRNNRPRTDNHPTQTKLRYEKNI